MKTLALLLTLIALSCTSRVQAEEVALVALNADLTENILGAAVRRSPLASTVHLSVDVKQTASVAQALTRHLRQSDGLTEVLSANRLVRFASSGLTLREAPDSRITLLVSHTFAPVPARTSAHAPWTARLNLVW
jgi:hypothetical protein